MFDQLKAIMDMQKKIQVIKQELDKTEFEIRSADGLVSVTMNGSQTVKKVEFPGGIQGADPQILQQALTDAFNRAVKRSQELAAQKMKETTGLNLPGI